ncbi:heparinase II/III family protein [Martelella limonii]|uniref:heparinase II/III family protein n=1 Tax=Martelella limonii TaxID=1647649 RepID=UPI0015803EAC|nr:heparinase II/III family protein [Martelella limonii]
MDFPVTEIARYALLLARESLRRAAAAALSLPVPRWPGGRAPQLLVAPTDLRIADPLEGEDIVGGRFASAGELLLTEGRPLFSCDMPSEEFERSIASFSWLRHLRTQRDSEANTFAREAVLSFLRRHRSLSGPAWTTDVASSRLNAWLCHSTVILKGADAAFYRRFIDALLRHERILRRRFITLAHDELRLKVAMSIALASISLDFSDRRKRDARQRLDDALSRQILPDGGHISRSPDALLRLLLGLLPLRQTYINLEQPLPKQLVASIDRAYGALNFFRHSDGELALFNGTGRVPSTALSALLRYDEIGSAGFRALPHTGFHRLEAEGTVVIADAGKPLSAVLSKTAHAGTGAFELSSGKVRFVVNAGVPVSTEGDTARMARSTAAHSAASIDDRSSLTFSASSLLGPVAMGGIRHVEARREQAEDDGDRVVIRHDGYLSRMSLYAERSLTLSADGRVLDGLDRFRNRHEGLPRAGHVATIRFHLHPSIWTMQEDEDTIFITAPNNESWLFTAPGLSPRLEDSVFFAASSGARRTRQIVIEVDTQEHADIAWQFKRL